VKNKFLYIALGGIAIMVIGWVGFTKHQPEELQAKPSETKAQIMADDLYQQALVFDKNGKLKEARETYKQLMAEYPDFEKIDTIQKSLEEVNMHLIFSNAPTDKAVIHEVKAGDTLGGLSKKYGTTVELIKISNHLKNDVIRIGQKLRVWTGKFNIYVDKSQNILILKDENEVVKVYDVSTGQNGSTPVGDFKITSRLVDPVWFNRGVVVPPESPQNVLGTRWMGFDIPGYGIHGTVEPETIGQQVTAGCVRMKNQDIEELYSLVPVGTQVVIVN